MSRRKTVTVRLDEVTKAALDIYAAEQLAKTGKAVTMDKAIQTLLELVAPEILEQAKRAKGKGIEGKKK
jgi:hypothetical protein